MDTLAAPTPPAVCSGPNANCAGVKTPGAFTTVNGWAMSAFTTLAPGAGVRSRRVSTVGLSWVPQPGVAPPEPPDPSESSPQAAVARHERRTASEDRRTMGRGVGMGGLLEG